MSYQFSIWLDDRTARDLEILSHSEERKRGAMVKLLIRRAAQRLSEQNVLSCHTTFPSDAPKQEGTHATS